MSTAALFAFIFAGAAAAAPPPLLPLLEEGELAVFVAAVSAVPVPATALFVLEEAVVIEGAGGGFALGAFSPSLAEFLPPLL